MFGVTMGITYPLLSRMLEQAGHSGTLIGFNGAMTPLGMILTAALIPALVRRFGAWLVMLGATVGSAGVLALFAMTDVVALWFLFRFVLGSFAVAMFILSETWISENADGEHRGRLLTAYTSVLALGFCVGPLVLSVSGSEALTLAIAVACPLVAVIPLCTERSQIPAMWASGRVPVGALARQLSVLMVAVLAVSVFDAVTLQFLPLYWDQAGLAEGQGELALTTLLIGQMTLQFPLGWLADRIGGRSALLLSLVVGTAGALLLPVGTGLGGWLWPLIAVWGGVAFAGYPLVLNILGAGLEGESLLLGNTAFAVVWGIGGVVGPPYTGAAMDLWGANGMPWSLAALWVLALIVTATTLALRRKPLRS
ncbi:MFS transporter [Streptomyces sp. B-S-A8]|uniref:MFS transporter n=1 Tax=Streptomyces solicavernae TaxID=3043614 RepID=A0ABT6RYW5_9ACTN|nr:MFS transporter [Streptomyces sp. B-S-A8]MDI3389349.1 MFS transporter [Streptomyces sp. B-S-A8]